MKHGIIQRSGQHFITNKLLAQILKAEHVKTGRWGVFVTYPDGHPCELGGPCRHFEHYANQEQECERCSRHETQLYGRHAIGYGDHHSEPEH